MRGRWDGQTLHFAQRARELKPEFEPAQKLLQEVVKQLKSPGEPAS